MLKFSRSFEAIDGYSSGRNAGKYRTVVRFPGAAKRRHLSIGAETTGADAALTKGLIEQVRPRANTNAESIHSPSAAH